MEFEEFKHKIVKIKKMKLPGESAQFKMAPKERIDELKKIADVKKRSKKAGVLALFYHSVSKQTMFALILRKTYKGVHSAQIGFPGGKFEAMDSSLRVTALRETEEEIGLAPTLVEPIAMLPAASPKRRRLRVTPFVGLAQGPLKLRSEPSEIASIFDAPVSLFTDINNYQYFDLKNKHGALSFPCLPYKGYKIWGFTLNVLVDLFNSTLDAAVELEYPSEELIQELRERGQQ